MAALIAAGTHWTFWDRYFRAYTFESFVTHPFPELDRLYPQETVPGVAQPRAIPTADESERTIAADALDAAVEFAEQSQSTSLIVYHDGRIQLERYWLGAAPDRPVYSFSMHKSVVGMLVGIAMAEGLLQGVETPLATYLPEWRDDPRGRITLRDALQMASGFEPMEFPRNPFSRHVRRQIGTDIAAAAMSYRLVDEPGTKFDYNGANPTLLTLILERATGRRYADYLGEKLWKPLGNREATVWLDREGGLAMGATSLFATPLDWLRLGELVLNRGRVEGKSVVPEAWLREMTTPSAPNPTYGYLIWMGGKAAEQRTLGAFRGFSADAMTLLKADDVVYFDGLGGQRVYVVPSRRLVIVRTGILARTWDDTTLVNLLMDGISSPVTETDSG